jgi:NADH-quinone oxidoreductase subunit C
LVNSSNKSNKLGRVLPDFLLSQYKTLVCQSVVDYPELANRFENVNELLSYKKNHRFRLKEGGNEKTWLSSFVNLYFSANWSERENWDLFGVFLDGHPDLPGLRLFKVTHFAKIFHYLDILISVMTKMLKRLFKRLLI